MATCPLRQHALPRFDFLRVKPGAGHTLIQMRHCWLGNPETGILLNALSLGALHDSHLGSPSILGNLQMSLLPICWPLSRSIVGVSPKTVVFNLPNAGTLEYSSLCCGNPQS